MTSYTFVGENDPSYQYRWLDWANITMSHWNVSNRYVNSNRMKPSDHQLVINTSTSKLKIMFLNDTLPAPPSKCHIYLIYKKNYLLYPGASANVPIKNVVYFSYTNICKTSYIVWNELK